jgi:CO/xanthine dehydrogenase Mo-binding subunit
VTLDPLGGVSVVLDSLPQGQGHRTAAAQIVAAVFGLDRRAVVSARRSIPARTPGRLPPAIIRAALPVLLPERRM